jgi:hypothetical protein
LNPDEKISYPSFCKLRPKHCIKAQIRTDVCPKCKFLKTLLKRGRPTIQDEKLIKSLTEHRECAHIQREDFKEELEGLKERPKKGIVLIDFKENIRLWKSRDQDADSFRNNLISTVFSVVVFISQNNTLQAHTWTFCSNNLTHDSFFVKEALRQTFDTKEFKGLKLSSISFWMDGGPHFRSHELNGFLIDLESSGRFNKVKWNHFVEYHGKNYCDVHFSVVSHIFKVKNLIHLYLLS